MPMRLNQRPAITVSRSAESESRGSDVCNGGGAKPVREGWASGACPCGFEGIVDWATGVGGGGAGGWAGRGGGGLRREWAGGGGGGAANRDLSHFQRRCTEAQGRPDSFRG